MRFRIALILLLLNASAAHAQAQRGTQLWYQAYEAGVRDVGRSAWDSAVQNLQSAKQGGPRPARRVVFYGDRIDTFNPDYYLGVAYLNLRRFADADAAFERVRQANLIQANDSQFRLFQTQASTAKFELILLQADDYLAKGDLAQAKQASDQAAALGIDATRARAFQQRLADAAAKAAAPTQTAQQNPPPEAQQPGPVAQLPPAPPGPVAQVPPVVQEPPIAQGPPPIQTGPTKGPVPAPSPQGGQAVSGPAIPPANVRVETGIAAYLAGRYSDAATLLALAATSNPQGSGRARFFLACSLAALVLSGEREDSELVSAKAALQAAGRLDQFAADRRILSPRVLEALGIQR